MKRIQNSIVFVTGCFLAVACAHRPHLVEVSQNEPNARGLASIADGTSDGNSDTNVLSGANDKNVLLDLQVILHSQTASSDFLDRVISLVHLHERAQKDLTNFDDALDESVSSQKNLTPVTDRTNKTYSQLVTLQLMTHLQRDKITQLYAHLLETSTEANTNEKTVALQVIGELKRKMRRLSASERVFLQDLLVDLDDVQKNFQKDHEAQADKDVGKAPAIDTSFSAEVFATPEATTKFYDQNRGDIEVDIAETAAVVDPKVEEVTDKVHTLLNNSGLRAPNNSTIAPGTGPNGNLTGREFPTGTWAFTFDDGPSGVYTPHILDNLNANGMKGTFFWLAQNTKLAGTREAVTRALNEGEQPQCHSYTHANLAKAGTALIQKEVIQAVTEEQKEFGDIKSGYKIKFYRCPYGSCLRNQQVRSAIANLHLIHAFWNVDTLDWQDHNPASIVARAQKQMAVQHRGIILFHDIHPQSVVASGLLMKAIKADHSIRTVTLPQMIDELNH